MSKSKAVDIDDQANWTDKQWQALEAINDYKYILYGGAMGGGKSYWLRWALVKRLMIYFAEKGLRNVTVGLFCEDYPTLKDRHLSKIKFEFPSWLGEYQAQDKNFVLSPEYGNGVIAFRNLDEVSKYKSSEFAVIAVDELTNNQKDVFMFLRTRLRWTGIDDTKFLAGTNPGGIGHKWVKDMWLDGIFDENEQEADLFKFIPARADDNPHLSEAYIKNTLASLEENERRAYLEGDWDIFKGQYFTEFRREVHCCQPFEIPPEWKKIICIDYGFSKPSAVLWLAINPDGIIYVYRELYITGLIFSELAKRIIAMTPDSEVIHYWVADPSIWAKKGEALLSGSQMLESEYLASKKKTLLLLQGNNDRINGWQVLREHLKPFMQDEKITAKLQIFENCQNLIKSLPSLVYDAIRVEDLDTDGEDHCADALRYGLMSRPIPAKSADKIKQEKFDAKMKKNKIKIQNPYSLRRGY